MNILAFDTSSTILSIALHTEQGFFEHTISQGFRHSENLTFEIKSLLTTACLDLHDIDLIVCPEGPGSFTGLRIGIATAKGLSFALEKPFVMVPTLDMMAYGFDFFDGIVIPVLDARKQRFYASLYKKGIRTSEYLDISPQKLLMKLKDNERVLITGTNADLFYNISHKKFYLDPDFKRGYARNLIPLGNNIFKKQGPSPDTIGPVYLRKSEAEIGITS